MPTALILLVLILLILLPGIWAIIYYLYFRLTGQVSTTPDYDGELLDVPLAKKSKLKKQPMRSFRRDLAQVLLIIILGGVLLFSALLTLGPVLKWLRG